MRKLCTLREKCFSLFRRNFGNEFGLFIHSRSQIHWSLAREKRDFEETRERPDWLSSWSRIFTILTLVFFPPKNYGISLAKTVRLQQIKAGVNVRAVLTSLNIAFLPISRLRFKQRQICLLIKPLFLNLTYPFRKSISFPKCPKIYTKRPKIWNVEDLMDLLGKLKFEVKDL